MYVQKSHVQKMHVQRMHVQWVHVHVELYPLPWRRTVLWRAGSPPKDLLAHLLAHLLTYLLTNFLTSCATSRPSASSRLREISHSASRCRRPPSAAAPCSET